MKTKIYLFFLFFLLLSSSCTSEKTNEVETAYPLSHTITTNQEGYPAPEIPTTTEVVPVILPTQDSNLASITGLLLMEQEGKTQPVKNAILYLAPVLKDENGIERVVSFDRFSSNKAITDEFGKFTFFNVEFNKYGIVLDRVLNSYLLNDPNTNSDMLFEIKEPKEYNIGELRYEFLPEN